MRATHSCCHLVLDQHKQGQDCTFPNDHSSWQWSDTKLCETYSQCLTLSGCSHTHAGQLNLTRRNLVTVEGFPLPPPSQFPPPRRLKLRQDREGDGGHMLRIWNLPGCFCSTTLCLSKSSSATLSCHTHICRLQARKYDRYALIRRKQKNNS